jgi:CheY-like chemotaxis protein
MTSTDPPASRKTLAGLRILVVEDEPLVAMLAEEILRDAQAQHVAIANNERAARAILDVGAIDAAVVDVNLWGAPSFTIGARLRGQKIPFVFATGYGDQVRLPDNLVNVPVVTKPFPPGELVAALLKAMAAAG